LRGRLERFLDSEPVTRFASARSKQPTARPLPAQPDPQSDRRPGRTEPVLQPDLGSGPREPGLTEPGPGRSQLPRLHPLAVSSPIGGSRSAAIGPDGLVALICFDNSLRIWSPSRAAEIAQCRSYASAAPVLLAWSPWRRHVATANLDGSVVVWDLQREVPQVVIRTGWQHVHAVAFSANGRWIAVAGPARQIQVYGADGVLTRRIQLDGPRDSALGLLAFRPGDRRLLAARDDGVLCELDVHGTITGSWQHPMHVIALAASADLLATSLPDGRLRLWSWDGRLAHRSRRPATAPYLVWAPDAASLFAIGNDHRLSVLATDGTEAAYGVLAGRPVGAGSTANGVVTVTDTGIVERWAAPRAEESGR
jgi:hypothetical protein